MLIEDNISTYEDFETLREKLSEHIVNKFMFYVNITIDPPGLLEKKIHIAIECNISSLLDNLENYIEHN